MSVLVLNVGRYVLSMTFLCTGAVHYMRLPLFVGMIHDYRILPFPAAVTFGEIVPRLEILLGVFLLVGCWLIEAYFTVIVLVALFLLASVWALLRGLDITCGCCGPDSPLISWWHVAIQVVLLTFAHSALRIQLANEGSGSHV